MQSEISQQKSTFSFLQGGGEMGELIRNLDWDNVSIKNPNHWPLSLRITIGNLLHSAFPMFLFWGSELICFYNDAFRPSLGVDGKHPAIGKRGEEVWPEIWEFIGSLIEEVMKTGKPVWFEDQLVPFYRNGQLEDIYWTFSYSAVFGDDGTIEGVLVVCNETTERVLTLKKIRESESQFRNMVAQAPVAIAFTLGEDLVVESVNKPMVIAMKKTSESEIVGKKLLEVLPEIKGQSILNVILKVLRTGEPFKGSAVPIKFLVDGKLEDQFFDLSYTPIVEQDEIKGVLHLAINVTEQVISNKKIGDSEEKYRSLFKSMDQGSCIIEIMLDEQGKPNDYRFLETNPVFEEQTGLKNAIGKTARQLVPNLEPHWFALYGKVASTGEAIRFEEGSEAMGKWFDVFAFRLGGNESRKVVLLFTDISERKKRDDAIRISESNLRNTILQAPVAMCIFRGPAFVVEIANERMVEFWGKKSSDVLHKPIFEGLPEVKGQGFEALLEKVFTTGETVKAYGVPVNLPRDGKIENLYVDFVYEAYHEADGVISGVIAVAIDITESMLARKRIEESEQRFQNLIREASIGVIVLMGEDMTVSVVNAAYAHLINHTVEELLDKPLFEIIPEAEDSFRPLIDEVRLKGNPLYLYDRAYQVYTNGEKLEGYLNLVFQPYREATGEITGVTALVQDVTEQVEAKQKLKEANERATLAIEAGGLGTVEVDLLTDEVIISKRMEEIFELESGNERKAFIANIHPDDLSQRKKAYDKAFGDGQLEYEARVVRKNNSHRWIRVKGRMFFDEAGKPLKLVSVVHDITDQKLFAEELRKQVLERTAELETLNKELQRSNAYLEEFAHAASHDLKEPIRKIHFFTDRLKNQLSDKLTKNDEQIFGRVQYAVKRMNSLIDDLLLYSHVSQKPHEKETVDLNDKLKKILEDLELEIEEKKAIIYIGRLPKVKGYRRQLQQLFQNLLSNALKYSRADVAPQIEINASILTGSEAGLLEDKNYHWITVKDNGIGFEQLHAEKIFQMFQRLHGKNEYGGTGVGLSIARKVAENHNGKITAEGRHGQGAQFHVYLPVE